MMRWSNRHHWPAAGKDLQVPLIRPLRGHLLPAGEKTGGVAAGDFLSHRGEGGERSEPGEGAWIPAPCCRAFMGAMQMAGEATSR